MLEHECSEAGVRIFLNVSIDQVSKPDEFLVRAGEMQFRAPRLVVATGGLSIPKMGATSFGYDLARQFGLKISEPRSALVPFVLSPQDRDSYCDLSGVSAEVVASYNGQSFREKMLITHKGLSGPAILQISSYWKPGHLISIDLAPDHDVFVALQQSISARNMIIAKAALQQFLPNRFASRWLELHEPKTWTNLALDRLEAQVHQWTIIPAGTEGFAKAEVTAGGVDTNELSAKTMESKKVPGLFFIGEMLDVTGQLGGFNFQWAWASGAAAGRAI
jgi:predicted Rossmann fold flavoprotein